MGIDRLAMVLLGQGLDPRRDALPGAARAQVTAFGFKKGAGSAASGGVAVARADLSSTPGGYHVRLGNGNRFAPLRRRKKGTHVFERFTERARQVVVLAQDEARALKHNYIGTEHILLGLLREEEGLAARVLESLDITVEEVRAQVARIVGQGDEVTTGQIPVHAACEEGARARAARGALPRPQLHRHRAHPARPRSRERGRRRAHPARLRRRRGEDPQRDHPHALRAGPSPAGPGRRNRREVEELEAPRPVRPQPDEARRRGQARPGRRPPDRDRARDADPVAPHEEQPGADRRAGRRQDGRRRGPRHAHQREPGAGPAQEQADLHARPGGARRGLEVPRRVRGAPEEGDEGDHPARRHHPVHRRAPQPRRRGRRRGRDRRGVDPQAGAGSRRAPDDRRDDARRVPQVPRARRGARAALPADPRRGAVDRGHRADPARPARPLRGAPPLQDHRRRPRGGGDARRPLHPGPPPAGQGDRPDRRGRVADADQDDERTAALPRARGGDRAASARTRKTRSRTRSSRRPPRCATRSAS